MARDSKLWEEAYKSYKKYKPSSKYNPKSSTVIRVKTPSKEPMLLLEEYKSVVDQIKELNKRRNALKKQLKDNGTDPTKYTRSDYYQRPILIYVLKLQDNCWYIGMSRNVDRRFKSHLKGKTLWTSKHAPIAIHEVRETGTNSDSEAGQIENDVTIEYARKYGVHVVRGGGYCQMKPRWPEEVYEPDFSWITA